MHRRMGGHSSGRGRQVPIAQVAPISWRHLLQRLFVALPNLLVDPIPDGQLRRNEGLVDVHVDGHCRHSDDDHCIRALLRLFRTPADELRFEDWPLTIGRGLAGLTQRFQLASIHNR